MKENLKPYICHPHPLLHVLRFGSLKPMALCLRVHRAEEVTHGENGFLCENTVESIADGILGALPTAAQVGARARDTIPIPWDRLMQRVLARYQRLIDRHGERRPA